MATVDLRDGHRLAVPQTRHFAMRHPGEIRIAIDEPLAFVDRRADLIEAHPLGIREAMGIGQMLGVLAEETLVVGHQRVRPAVAGSARRTDEMELEVAAAAPPSGGRVRVPWLAVPRPRRAWIAIADF